MNKFWNWSVSASGDNELILDGDIAKDSWWDDEVTPKLFREELAKYPGDVTVRINSNGGDVSAGVAIYNYLAEHEGTVTIKVDGMAASIASLIAMAGDKIIMLPGSMMMVHLPWTYAAGNADDLAQVIESLQKFGESIVPIYVARTGLSEERINELLKAETWMTAQDAVELGFADEAIEAKGSLADAMAKIKEMTPLMQSAVMQPVMSMKAKKAEELDVTNATEEPAEDADETTEAAAEQEKSDETVEPETTEVTEPVAKGFLKPQLKEKETKMTDVEQIAVSQVLEPKAQADPATTPKPSVKSYLKTNESMEAFARILEEHAVSASAKDVAGTDGSASVRAAWQKHLEVKAGVTNPEIFLPTPLIQEIEDAFKQGGEIWQRVSKTGMDSFNAAWDANSDPDDEKGRAKGYNRDEEEEKAEQELTIANRILRPQFVYKYITLNKEDVKEQRTTGALVRFVLSELPKRIIREVERAIVIGDGRANGSDYKIQTGSPRGFFPVKADAAAGNAFARTYTPAAGQTVYETLRRARALVKADGGVILVAKEGLLLDMEFEQNANGGFLFAPGSDLTRYIKVDAVVEPDWMDDDENDAYIFAYGYYRVVGDQSVEAFQNFILKTNKNEYLQEIWAGGGLTALKSGVAVAPQATS